MNVYGQLREPLALVVFVLTLGLPVIVGLLALRRARDQSDFFVGGMAMNRVVVALSAVSSGRSSWLVLGLCGLAYTRGLSALWAIVGYVVVEMLQFVYIGRRLRSGAKETEAITLLDFLEARFEDKGRVIRTTGAVIIAIFITAYVAAQLNAGALSLCAALGISKILALLVAAALIIVYMVLGGFIAVAYNDVVRAVIMLVGLVLLPVIGLLQVGGVGAMLSALEASEPALIDPFALTWGAFLGFVGIGLGSPGQPHILVRYMSIDDPEQLRISSVIGTVWNVILGWGALFIGLVGRVMIPAVSELPEGNPEMVYLALSTQLFGPALYGLLVGGVFAAILSTADSQLLVVASTVVRDVYEKLIMRDRVIDEGRKLALSRVVVVLAGLIAVVLAYIAEELVFWLVLFAWGGLGAAFGPAVILALYDRKTTRAGIVAGMVVGTVTIIVWKLWLKDATGLYELIPGFALAFVTIFAVSRLDRSKRAGDP
jgi:solute:Na+ symporter, SSS family